MARGRTRCPEPPEFALNQDASLEYTTKDESHVVTPMDIRTKLHGSERIQPTVQSFLLSSSAPSLTETTTGAIVPTQSFVRLWLNRWITSSPDSRVEPTT